MQVSRAADSQAYGPTWPAPDAAGAASNLARFSCVFRAVARLAAHTRQRRR